MPSGLTFYGASNIVLNCNGATLNGAGYSGSHGMSTYDTTMPNPLKNVTIKNCIINNYDTAIDLANSNSFLIQNNTFDSILGKGVYITSGCNINLTKNSFNNVRNGSRGSGIEFTNGIYYSETLQGCTYVFSAENNIIQNSYRGLHITNTLYGIPLTNYSFTIKGNTVSDVSNGGMFIALSDIPGKIYNNTFRNNIWYQIGIYAQVTNLEVYNNTLYNQPSWHGIYFHPQNYYQQDIDIHDNDISQFQGGVFFEASQGVKSLSKNVRIHNNRLHNSMAGYAQYGVSGIMAYENNISNNYIGLQFEGEVNNPDPSYYFLNSIYGNTYNSQGTSAQELSFQKKGNYWGHASPPCFTETDTNRADIVDSYPFCVAAPSTAIIISIPNPGWYFFGSNGMPRNTSVKNITSEIVGNINDPNFEVIQYYVNGAPKIYKPTNPSFLNTLTDILPWYGYWMKINYAPTDSIWLIAGDKATSTPLSLNINQHWVGYWCGSNRPTAAALTSVAGKYANIRTYENGVWKTYDPALPQFSDLLEMKPGNAYLIKMNATGSLNYVC
ncbi:MAG: right-handed parallel beta-helix repeat-containing protein [Nanoarchaeota archaeon]